MLISGRGRLKGRFSLYFEEEAEYLCSDNVLNAKEEDLSSSFLPLQIALNFDVIWMMTCLVIVDHQQFGGDVLGING